MRRGGIGDRTIIANEVFTTGLRLELREDDVIVDGDRLERSHRRSERLERAHIAHQLRLDRRALHLDRDLLAAVGRSEDGAVHLRHRSRAERPLVEFSEDIRECDARRKQLLHDDRLDEGRGHWVKEVGEAAQLLSVRTRE